MINIISEILRESWAIDPSYASVAMPMVEKILTLDGNFEPMKSDAATNQHVEVIEDDGSTSDRNIRILQLRGPLTKYSQSCGPEGLQAKSRSLHEAYADDSVDAVIIIADTPGGSVSGTREMANAVADRNKPVVVFGDGMIASAGMWIAAAADAIVMGDEFNEIGSIGVMASFADMQPKLEAEGVKFHKIFASQSFDKNKDYKDVMAGNYDDFRANRLDPLAADFIATVKNNRKAMTDDQLTGKIFFAKDVVGSMVDSIGSYEDAIKTSLNLINNYKVNINSNQTVMSGKNTDEAALRSKVAALFGFGAKADDKAQEPSIEEKLAELEANSIQFENEKAEELAAKDQEIEHLKAEMAELRKQPGATAAVVAAATDGTVAADPATIKIDKRLSFADQLAAFSKELNRE